jgi:hypothetical protein
MVARDPDLGLSLEQNVSELRLLRNAGKPAAKASGHSR